MAAVKLWNLRPIIIASIIGTPTAGCILMALNYYRSGEKKTAILTLSAGIAIAAMDLVAPFLLPSILAGLLAVVALIAAIYFAVKIHRPFLQEQVSAGTQRASIWSGIGVGAALWVVYTLVAFISFGGLPTAGRFTTLAVGAKDDVYIPRMSRRRKPRRLGRPSNLSAYFKTAAPMSSCQRISRAPSCHLSYRTEFGTTKTRFRCLNKLPGPWRPVLVERPLKCSCKTSIGWSRKS